MRHSTSVLGTLLMLCFSFTCFTQSEVELRADGIIIPRLASAPNTSGSTEGQLYYNTSLDEFEYFDGTTWQALVMSGSSSSPYKIEDLVDADTYVLTSDNSAIGQSDIISISISGTPGMQIDQIPSKELRLEFIDGSDNIIIGDQAANEKAGGANNVFVGDSAGMKDVNSSDNTFIGADTGKSLIDAVGNKNVFVGSRAGELGQLGANNIYIGYESGKKNAGNGNVFIGHQAGDDQSTTNERLIINNNSVSTNPLIFGRFGSVGFVRIGGDLEINPMGSSNNSRIRMPDANGNMDEVVRRNVTTGDIVVGDVNSNGGDLGLRADGQTRLSVLADGTIKFWPMTNPPGTCNSSRAGQVYYDSDDDKLKTCGRSFGVFGWQNMY